MTDHRKIARLTIEGTQGAGKTTLLKALCRMMNDSGAVILGAKDWDSQSAILLDMDGFAFPKFAEYGKNYTTSQGLDPIAGFDAEMLDRAIERQTNGSDERRFMMLEPAGPVGFLPFHDVLLRQIAAKVGVPFEGLGHTVPAAKDHRAPIYSIGPAIVDRERASQNAAHAMTAPYGGRPAQPEDPYAAMAEHMFGASADPQPGGVCGDAPGDAAASGDIGIDRLTALHPEANDPPMKRGSYVGPKLDPEIEAFMRTARESFDPTTVSIVPHVPGEPRPNYRKPELSPPAVQERAWNAWLSAHASGLSPLGHIRALHEIVGAIYPSTKDTIPSADDLIQGVKDMLLQEIARQGHDRLVEDAIVERCLSVFIEHGYEIKVMDDFDDDGEEAQDYTTDKNLIRAALRSTAGDRLYLRHPNGGAGRPWVAFVWGNGVDVIHDYSTRQAEHPIAGMATMMAEIEAFVGTLDDRRPAAK